MSIEDEARQEAERRWPTRAYGGTSMNGMRRDDFEAGYIAGANRAQEATGGVPGGRGDYVEPPEPPRRRAQEATREQVARIISGAVGGWNQEARTITDVADALLAQFDIREKERS